MSGPSSTGSGWRGRGGACHTPPAPHLLHAEAEAGKRPRDVLGIVAAVSVWAGTGVAVVPQAHRVGPGIRGPWGDPPGDHLQGHLLGGGDPGSLNPTTLLPLPLTHHHRPITPAWDSPTSPLPQPLPSRPTQGTRQQLFAANQLKAQGWRFHEQFNAWFARQSVPKVVTETYEQVGAGCGCLWCGVVWCGVVWCGVVWWGDGVGRWGMVLRVGLGGVGKFTAWFAASSLPCCCHRRCHRCCHRPPAGSPGLFRLPGKFCLPP